MKRQSVTTDNIFKILMMRYLALSRLDRYKYTVELHLSGSPIIQIGLALRVNLSKILKI
jgi:hypothetical protein